MRSSSLLLQSVLVGKVFLFNVSGNPASRDAEQKYMKEAAEGRIEALRDSRWWSSKAQPSNPAIRSLKYLAESQNACWHKRALEAAAPPLEMMLLQSETELPLLAVSEKPAINIKYFFM